MKRRLDSHKAVPIAVTPHRLIAAEVPLELSLSNPNEQLSVACPLKAKQSADTAVNNAKKYANQVTPAAKADADEIIKRAEAYRQSKINEAEGQAARFTELFNEYEKYPLITKQRLFYEAMEKILPDMKLYIIDADTGVQTMLPLDKYAEFGGDEVK